MLSIIIIAKNEQSKIKTCLESVKWADEIIVADNGSVDNTVNVSKTYTKNVLSFTGQSFSELRNKAFSKAKGDWVLYIDADERVLTPLKEEIQGIIANVDSKSAYGISRRNIIFGHEEKYGPFWPDWVVRLIQKKAFKGWVGDVHEYVKFSGDLGYTNNSLLHLTHRGVDHMINKNLAWSRIDAKLRFDANHPKMTGWRFLRILITELFNQGIVRRGFFAGTIGIMDSLIQVFSLIITYVRLWEMQQEKSLDQAYDEIDKQLISGGFNY